ncbi:MAG TPA: isoaspartyl peptidase/L-asparaginase [Sphingomicrobium sp.]|nr:isoaspartyl peptidase/L-asparaginase [Sphingomicrobium sp.]
MTKINWKLVIHGGAGVIEKARISAEDDRTIRAALDHALATGAGILDSGGSSLDAVEAAVAELEDDPHFNAGRGAVFTYEGRNELDAAIMDGRDRTAGAVTGITATRHPVSLARAVIESSPHVFLRGLGADEFSLGQGLEQVPNEWFGTSERRRQLAELKARQGTHFDTDLKYGTVGAVALDVGGHVAAATSTGGLTGKRWGRIGDSPIIGAGTWADDRSAAVSATGSGEHFIRAAAAHQLSQRMLLAGQPLQEALDDTLADIRSLGGNGGLIAVDWGGNAAWGFTTPGMYRGIADPDDRRVALYSDEEER